MSETAPPEPQPAVVVVVVSAGGGVDVVVCQLCGTVTAPTFPLDCRHEQP